MKREAFKILSDSAKLDEIYKSTEKTRKYIKWGMILSIVVIVVPLLFLPFAISKFLGIYSSFSSLGL